MSNIRLDMVLDRSKLLHLGSVWLKVNNQIKRSHGGNINNYEKLRIKNIVQKLQVKSGDGNHWNKLKLNYNREK